MSLRPLLWILVFVCGLRTSLFLCTISFQTWLFSCFFHYWTNEMTAKVVIILRTCLTPHTQVTLTPKQTWCGILKKNHFRRLVLECIRETGNICAPFIRLERGREQTQLLWPAAHTTHWRYERTTSTNRVAANNRDMLQSEYSLDRSPVHHRTHTLHSHTHGI